MDSYEIVTSIGKGSSGAVFLARSTKIKKPVAIKKIEIDESRKSRCRRSVIREADILRTLNHFHIVKCYEWFLDEMGESISMVLEYCNGGTLQDRIVATKIGKNVITEDKILQWTAQITSAVAYIHERRILHRDLKSENVFLVKSSEDAKLGDFGISKEIDHTLDKAMTCVGTPCYLSPELCRDIPYSFASDIWALGCLVFEMTALKPAFDAANLISLFHKIVNGKHADLPGHCPVQVKNLIGQILTRDPDVRPTAQQLLDSAVLRPHRKLIRKSSNAELVERDVVIKQPPPVQRTDWNELDDLDELLKSTDDELSALRISQPRSFSVHGQMSCDEMSAPAPVADDEMVESPRPQTCPDSAVSRRFAASPGAETVSATWSGYGDRGARLALSLSTSSDSDDDDKALSDYTSGDDTARPKKKKKNRSRRFYKSDESLTTSDSEEESESAVNSTKNKQLNSSRVEDEIPEEIDYDPDSSKGASSGGDPTASGAIGPGRNLPGSAWLQSKRAQVLRQRQGPGLPAIVVTGVQRQKGHLLVNQSLPSLLSIDTSGQQQQQHEQHLQSTTSMHNHRHHRLKPLDITLHKPKAEPVVKNIGHKTLPPAAASDVEKRLPGSAWLLGSKQRQAPAVASLESNSTSATRSNKHDTSLDSTVDYPDDFEDDYDDDEFEPDVEDTLSTRTLSGGCRVSSMEVVKQRCIDSIGMKEYQELSSLIKQGHSVDKVYERCKDKIDYETLETCFLIMK